MNRVVFFLVTCLSIGLTSCASMVSGTSQNVSVHNGAIQGATCTLENDKGRWYISRTPGSVALNRSAEDLKINCQKRGYKPSFQQISSKTKNIVYGNVLLGGIPAGIDVVNGAAFDYPTDIYVPMKKMI